MTRHTMGIAVLCSGGLLLALLGDGGWTTELLMSHFQSLSAAGGLMLLAGYGLLRAPEGQEETSPPRTRQKTRPLPHPTTA